MISTLITIPKPPIKPQPALEVRYSIRYVIMWRDQEYILGLYEELGWAKMALSGILEVCKVRGHSTLPVIVDVETGKIEL